jgi:MFS family permease
MDPITQAEIKRNFKFNFTTNLIDGTFFWLGSSFYATRTIAPLFLSYLTDNTLVFGILATIVSTGWLLPQLFTAGWVQRTPLKKYFPVTIGFFTERLPILLLPLAAWIALRSESWAAVLFLILIGWHVIGAGVVAVGWQDMLAKIFPVEWRGRFFGITNFAGNATGILGASAAAWMLERFPYPTNFMYAFGAGGLFIFLSWIFLALTREPISPPKPASPDQPPYWRSLVPILQNDLNYRRYLVSQMVTAVGGMALGFYTIYALRQWQVSDGMVSLFTTSLLIGTAGANLLFGWLGDRYGHKFIMEISIIALVLATGVALLAPTPEYFYLVFALQGANNAGFILSGISIVFEFCEEDVRPTYIGLTNSMIGIFAGLSPLLGGYLAENASFTWLFSVSLAFSLIGLLLLHFRVREPRGSNHKESPL